jgi:NADPH:quinone reductase-like Zn-dependent oxidoreductase
LINGAGGSAGTYAVQLAKAFGAEVTGVDLAGKLDYLRRLGADHAIDYTRQDFTRMGQRYDLILDLIAHRPVFAYLRALKPGGSSLFVGGSLGTLFQILLLGPLLRRMTSKQVRLLMVRRSRKALIEATTLCQAGKMPVVIDRVFPLAEAPEALRYMGAGLSQGKVVISLES